MASEKLNPNNPYYRAHQSHAHEDEEDLSPSISENVSVQEDSDAGEEPPAYTRDTGIRPSEKSSSQPTQFSDRTQSSNQTQSSRQTQSLHQTPSSQSNLQKPVAIPAIDDSFDAPFIRAYPPVLKNYQLPQEVFLSFLDRLNKAVSSSPPLTVLDATGGMLKSVPILFPLRWIGAAVSGIASLGNQGASKNRTDGLLDDANRDIFGPRGLKIEVAKLDALAHIARIPILDSQGKVSRQAALFRQLAAVEMSLGNSADEDEMATDAQQKRIQMLQPWIADLELDILPWTSKSKLTRFNEALKKHNGEDNYGPRGRRRRMRQMQEYYPQQNPQEVDDPFRKCLWLVIRELEREDGPSR